MCTTVSFRGQIIHTPRQLSRLVGSTKALRWRDREGDLDWCLCVIDIPKTLEGVRLKFASQHPESIFVVEV